MALHHPKWCHGNEPPDRDEHVSETLQAAQPDDLTDIRLRLTQPSDEWVLAMVELEFMDNDELTVFPLPVDQARLLSQALGQLVAKADACEKPRRTPLRNLLAGL